MKRIYQNIAFPIKLRKQNTDSETINLFNYRDVFYNGEVNIDALDIDSRSSATFLDKPPIVISGITVESGKILLIDKDVRISGDVTISSGGELRNI